MPLTFQMIPFGIFDRELEPRKTYIVTYTMILANNIFKSKWIRFLPSFVNFVPFLNRKIHLEKIIMTHKSKLGIFNNKCFCRKQSTLIHCETGKQNRTDISPPPLLLPPPSLPHFYIKSYQYWTLSHSVFVSYFECIRLYVYICLRLFVKTVVLKSFIKEFVWIGGDGEVLVRFESLYIFQRVESKEKVANSVQTSLNLSSKFLKQ